MQIVHTVSSAAIGSIYDDPEYYVDARLAKKDDAAVARTDAMLKVLVNPKSGCEEGIWTRSIRRRLDKNAR